VRVLSGQSGDLLLQLAPPPSGDRFGFALASGDANGDGLRDLLVGAPAYDGGGAYTGAVHAYTILRSATTYCWAKTNSQGCTPEIFSVGVPSASDSTLRARARFVLNNQNGTLFWGRTPQATPFQGGFLCVEQPVVRTPVQSSGGNPPPADCSGTYSFHFSSTYMGDQGIAAGDQIYCQYWSRDPASPSTTGLTGGLAFFVLP
jgi:hypothetical protein